MKKEMKILLVSNDGDGFANYKDVAKNITVGELFKSEMSGQNPSNFLVRVNREQVSSDYVLSEGNRVTITPKNIEGA